MFLLLEDDARTRGKAEVRLRKDMTMSNRKIYSYTTEYQKNESHTYWHQVNVTMLCWEGFKWNQIILKSAKFLNSWSNSRCFFLREGVKEENDMWDLNMGLSYHCRYKDTGIKIVQGAEIYNLNSTGHKIRL